MGSGGGGSNLLPSSRPLCFCVLSAADGPPARFISLLPSVWLGFHACVCFRLADRHTGPAAGGRGPHPPLLPPGAHLALLQLQESLLQAHSCHTLHCRYVEYSETTELSIVLHHNSQLERSTQAQNSTKQITSPHDIHPWCIKAVSYDHRPLIFRRSSI